MLLIVSYHYHPEENPRAIRWKTVADYLSAEYNILVYCKTGFVFYGEKNHEHSTRMPNIRDNNLKHLTRCLRYIRWPDYAFLWIFKFILFDLIKIIKIKNKINKIISVSHPFSSHIIAFIINKITSLKYEVDVGDPFSFNPETPINNYFLYSKLNFFAESIILKKSKKIYVTNRNIANYFSNKFGIKKENIIINWPISRLPFKNYCINKNIVVSFNYYGSLYENQRTIDDVILAFNVLNNIYNNIVINIYGENESYILNYKGIIPENIKIYKKLDGINYLNSLYESNAVLNIGNNNILQLPSKLIDYIISGKNIYNFVKDVRDPSLYFSCNYKNIKNFLIPDGSIIENTESNEIIFDEDYNLRVAKSYV